MWPHPASLTPLLHHCLPAYGFQPALPQPPSLCPSQFISHTTEHSIFLQSRPKLVGSLPSVTLWLPGQIAPSVLIPLNCHCLCTRLLSPRQCGLIRALYSLCSMCWLLHAPAFPFQERPLCPSVVQVKKPGVILDSLLCLPSSFRSWHRIQYLELHPLNLWLSTLATH